MRITAIIETIENNSKRILVIFFLALFVLGLLIYKDYGISWDEGMQWQNNGYVNYNYVVHHDKDALLQGNEKYHGPAFELLLVGIEKVFEFSDTRAIFLMRHLMTFLTFFVSVIFFYLLCDHCFKNWKLALLGCLFFVLSPRIFAESFYNSKDIVFLAFFIISMYTLILFYERQTYLLAIVHALVCAFMIDIRIIGIIIPFISIAFVGLKTVSNFLSKEKSKINFGSFLLFLLLLLFFIVLFWPILWEGPVFHFMEAFKEMSRYHWNHDVLYLGKYIPATELPWHYLLVWIGITTPIFYLFLFAIGVVVLFKDILTNPLNFFKNRKIDVVVLLCFFVSLITIIGIHSVVYDAWRHVFFIYSSFIIIALHGVSAMYKLSKKVENEKYILIIIFISFFTTSYSMIKLHPYQNVYFNSFAGRDMSEVKNKFEMDYWSLSSREALEYILKTDTSQKIIIFDSQLPQKLNAQILPLEERKRLLYTEKIEDANYFIGNYRWHREDYSYNHEIFSVKIGNAKIISVFKFRLPYELYKEVKGKSLLSFTTDFENKRTGWSNNMLKYFLTGAHSGQMVTAVTPSIEYSDGLIIKDMSKLYNKRNLVLKTSFWRNDKDERAEAWLVINIETSKGESYFWHAIKTINDQETDIWKKIEGAVDLPPIRSMDDVIKIYLWNKDKKEIYMDDINVEFIQEEFEAKQTVK